MTDADSLNPANSLSSDSVSNWRRGQGEEGIVVTGIGLVTPLGNGREKSWDALLEGRSGIARTGGGLEARVRDFSPNGARSRAGDFALLAAEEAARHAGLPLDAAPIGVVIGQSKPIPFGHGDGALDPALLLGSFTGWSPEAAVRRWIGRSGPSANVSAACATGIAALETGARMIRDGACDAVLAGASESSLNAVYRAGFSNMGVLAEGGPENVRPFDRERSGFAMGEGAAVLVLERASAARRRGARALARLGRVALRHSAGGAVRFDPEGTAVRRLVESVMEEGVDYVNAHGTGTRLNDAVEVRGLMMALGARAAGTPVTSTKAATGHLLGAAGAVEAAFCVLALRDQTCPPTLNWSASDAEDPFDHVPGRGRRTGITTAMSLSYGFGGQMGAVTFEAVA